TDASTMLATTLSTVTAAVVFSTVAAAGAVRSVVRKPGGLPSAGLRRLSRMPVATTLSATNGSPNCQPAIEVTTTGIATAGRSAAKTSAPLAAGAGAGASAGAGSGAATATGSASADSAPYASASASRSRSDSSSSG